MNGNTRVLLGVTGSIAAYKSAELIRLMKTRGWDVSCVMTRAATRFIGELTLGTLSRNPVAVEMFAGSGKWKPEHISLSEWGHAMLIAPCTANVIAKLANGIADDLLTCTVLAGTVPLVIAPAMNVHMWDNPATVANVSTLTSRGVTIVDVGSGDLACGYEGRGRMAEPDRILSVLESVLGDAGGAEES